MQVYSILPMFPENSAAIGMGSMSFILGIIMYVNEVGSTSGEVLGPTNVQQPHGFPSTEQIHQSRKCGILYVSLKDCPCDLFDETNSLKENHSSSLCHQRTRLLLFRLQREKCTKEETYSQTTYVSPTRQRVLTPYNSYMTLHQACMEGNLDAVKYIVSHHLEDINCREKSGRTPVMGGAREGQTEVFDYLVSQGCDLSIRDIKNNSVLHQACRGGNTYIVRRLITELKQDIDELGVYLWTPVMFAVYSGHMEVVELLVNEGCNVRSKDIYNYNILHLACMKGQVNIVKFILKNKLVDINGRGRYERTAVMVAVLFTHREITEILKEHLCDLRLVDNVKQNILHIACRKNNVSMVDYIFTLNIVHKESNDQYGFTPMMIAVLEGHKDVFKYLKQKGCNWRARVPNGNTILHLACIYGQSDMVEYIVRQNLISVERKGYRGRTPLLTTAGTVHITVFALLIRLGSNVESVDDDNNNILHLACIHGHHNMVIYIIKQNIVDIESRGSHGKTPLLHAAGEGFFEIVSLLLRSGCYVGAVNNNNYNVLHLACSSGNVEMVRYIVTELHFDVNCRGYKGKTPVMIAAAYGHLAVVKFLKEKSCNMKAVNTDGNNIMHMACADGQIAMVKYLMGLRLVALNNKNKFGHTPLTVAKKYGHVEIVNLITTEKYTS